MNEFLDSAMENKRNPAAKAIFMGKVMEARKAELHPVPDWAKDKYEQWTEGGEVLFQHEMVAKGLFFVLFKYGHVYQLQSYFMVGSTGEISCDVRETLNEPEEYDQFMIEVMDWMTRRLR